LPDGLVSNETSRFVTFWKPFEWKILISFYWWPLTLFYGHWAHGVDICYIIPSLVFFIKAKSGNPEFDPQG
jgi:hypothetical protein